MPSMRAIWFIEADGDAGIRCRSQAPIGVDSIGAPSKALSPTLLWFVTALLLAVTAPGAAVAGHAERDLPGKLLIGYWHNWAGWPVTLRLTEIPASYDVVVVAFATPTVPAGATMRFAPDPGIYPTGGEFVADVQALQAQGKKVLISIGGGADPITVDDPTDAASFVTSMSGILDQYGFDGVDVDLEGGSLALDPGDDDFRSPTSPRIVYFIEALSTLMALYPGHLLSAAPETAQVQGGYQAYSGIWGAYLPVIHALRERWSFIHVQHYNTGSMFGRDGNIYEPATADFHAAMAEMLLAGFTVDVWDRAIPFPPLRQDQVAIGLPAGPQAGGGYTPPDLVHQALDYLIRGIPFGGRYELANPDGYPAFRGLMTWSINWDSYYGYEFSRSHRTYLDGLTISVPEEDDPDASSELAELRAFPNPARRDIAVRYRLRGDAEVECELLDLRGRSVRGRICQSRSAGEHVIRLEVADLPSGIYSLRVTVAGRSRVGRIAVIR